MRTKVLSVRIPENHWIFNEPDIRATVLLALRLYGELDGEIQEMRTAIDEVKSMLSDGITVATKTPPEPDTDPRLAKAIGNFLDL